MYCWQSSVKAAVGGFPCSSTLKRCWTRLFFKFTSNIIFICAHSQGAENRQQCCKEHWWEELRRSCRPANCMNHKSDGWKMFNIAGGIKHPFQHRGHNYMHPEIYKQPGSECKQGFSILLSSVHRVCTGCFYFPKKKLSATVTRSRQLSKVRHLALL